MTRRGQSLALTCALVLPLGLVVACTGFKPEGHSTYFHCQAGRVVSSHAPLGADPDVEEFKSCDEERCVPVGQDCPAPLAKPEGACEADSDCTWDDDCVPTACVSAKPGALPADCDETAPPPGECRCVHKACTLLERAPVPPPMG